MSFRRQTCTDISIELADLMCSHFWALMQFLGGCIFIGQGANMQQRPLRGGTYELTARISYLLPTGVSKYGQRPTDYLVKDPCAHNSHISKV